MDFNSTYNGDQATVYGDNSANILHMADQLQAVNERRAALKQRQAEEDQRRQDAYQKYIGDRLDVTKNTDVNPAQSYIDNELQTAQKKLSAAAATGKLSESQLRQAVEGEVSRIKGIHDKATNLYQAAKDGAASYSTEAGLDHQKLQDLAIHDSFYSPDGKGNYVMDPNKWQAPNASQIAGQTLDKHYGTVGTGEGVDEAVQTEFGKVKPEVIDVPAQVDKETGQQIQAGYKINKHNFQELGTDAKGNPYLDIRKEPVIVDGKQITNPDGTPKMTIAKDLEDRFLSKPGFAIQVKKELNDKIGDENMKRQAINQNMINRGLPPTLPMISGDSHEAEILKSDIVLQKLRNNMPGGEIAIKDDKDFENRMKVKQMQNADAHLSLAKDNNNLAHQKWDWYKAHPKDLAADQANGKDFFTEAVNSYGKDVEVETKPEVSHFFGSNEPAEYGTKKIIPETADPKDLNIIVGEKNAKGVRPVQPTTYKTKDGGTVKGWEVNVDSAGAPVGLTSYDKKGKVTGTIDKNRVNETFEKPITNRMRKALPGVGSREVKPKEDAATLKGSIR